MKPPTPFKIVGKLVGVRHDDDGNIIGEEIMGDVAIYAAQFGSVQELVDEAVSAASDEQSGASAPQ